MPTCVQSTASQDVGNVYRGNSPSCCQLHNLVSTLCVCVWGGGGGGGGGVFVNMLGIMACVLSTPVGENEEVESLSDSMKVIFHVSIYIVYRRLP